VDRYIAYVHGRLDELRRELSESMRRAESAAQRAAEAEEAQAVLGRTLLNTQRAADAAIDDAEKQARAIVTAAEVQARVLLEEVSRQAQSIVADAHVAIEALVAAMRQPAPGPLVEDRMPELSRSTAAGPPPSQPGARPPDPGPNCSWVSTLTGRRLA